jgi:hypothetical protein
VTTWRRLLHAWAGRLPTRIVHHDGEPLFERSVVFNGRLPFVGEVTVYLHHYLVSDPDRGLHDHPWPWAISVPLAAGYHEQRLLGIGRSLRTVLRRRRPFVPYALTGHAFHRVILGHHTSWSLFITGPNRHKEWGFLRDEALPADGFGVATYTPHLDESGSHTAWWRTAPAGRLLRRAAP